VIVHNYIPEVLIIEDEAELAEVIKDSVDPSMKVACFADAGSAISRMESGFWPDVIVLDWALKSMRGMDSLSAIRKRNRDVPIILLSGSEDGGLVYDATRLGISSFFMKPFRFSDFEVEIKKGVLRSRLNRINDHLVRLLGDIVLGSQMQPSKGEAQNDIEERLEALAILSAEADWFIQYREQTIKEISGVLI
jgi:DNA-binding NtrC family response regulator